MNPISASPERLLCEASWMRRLARRLVAEQQTADDLTQDTWVRVLACSPAADRPLRGWIAAVMRNLARQRHRTETRRALHEARAIPAEPEQPPAVVQRLLVQRRVTEAVLALEEPYRTTVLLRYFEGLSPLRIAARQGVPVATVKTRLARGLGQLRRRLVAGAGGDGRAWIAAMMPLLRAPRGVWFVPSSLSLGVLAVHTKTIVAAALLVIAGASYAVWPSSRGSASIPAAPSAALRENAAAVSAPASPLPAAQLGERVRIAEPANAVSEPEAPPPGQWMVGRVIDLGGTGIAGVLVRCKDGEPGREIADGARTAADGSFRLALDGTFRSLVVEDERFTTVLAAHPVAERSGATPVIVVAELISLAGRVLDESGAPVGGARVVLAPPSDLRAGLREVLDFSESRAWEVETAADGAFALARAPSLPRGELTATCRGYLPLQQPAPLTSDDRLLLALQRTPAAGTVAGLVVDGGGAPVEGARVSMGIDSTATDARGRFTFALGERTFNHRIREFLEVDDGRILAVKPGHLPGEVKAARRDPAGRPIWPEQIVVTLGGSPLALSGSVVDATGAPRSGVRVWIADPTFFGGLGDPAEGGFPELTHVESLLTGARPGWHWVETDDAGAFRIEGLLDRTYTVQAMDPRTLLRSEVRDVRGGRSGVRIELSAENQFPTLRGRVVDSRGEPLAGIRVFPMCDAFATTYAGQTVSTQHGSAAAVRTDARGEFELRDVPRTLVYLRLEGEGTIPLEWGRHVAGGLSTLVEDPARVTITLGRRCHFQVRLDAADEADQIAVLDGSGAELEISEFLGSSRHEGMRQPLRDGRSGSLGVSDAARTVVLWKAGHEVRRVAIALRPEEVAVVR